jgi:hypothetical protein
MPGNKGNRVKDINKEGLTIESRDNLDHITARMVIWAGGITASSLGKILARRTNADTDKGGRSSRVMALNGLRMMPLFPSPSLKFRTARLPRYGFKADISDGAFPTTALLKLAPSIRSAVSGLPPSFAPGRVSP